MRECSPHVTCHMSGVRCHIQYHMSYVTCHMSHAMCHMYFSQHRSTGPIWSSSRNVCLSVCLFVPFPCNFCSPRGAPLQGYPEKMSKQKCTLLQLALGSTVASVP